MSVTTGSKADTVFSPRISQSGPYTVEVADAERKPGETRPRRHPKAAQGLITSSHPDIVTAFDIPRFCAKNFKDAKCVGSRPFLKTHKETKTINGQEKQWVYQELGPYSYLSYIEFRDRVDQLGAGLRNLGLKAGDKLHIYGATSLYWMSMAHGAFTQSMTIVTAYETLGIDGLKSSIQQTEPKAIFLDVGLVSTLQKILKDVPSIKTVIINTASTADPSSSAIDAFKAAATDIKVLTYDELLESGRSNPIDPVPPKAEDLACIMFTSGTTGAPKGVQIPHAMVVAAVAGAGGIFGDYFSTKDLMLAYLPLAHIIEFVFENGAMSWGSTLCYGSPKTLTDTGVRHCRGDLQEAKPTVLIGVPAVWELIKKGITGKVEGSGFLKKNLFWGALYAKQAFLSAGLPTGLFDLVLSAVSAATGGRLRIALSGGGPLSKDTQTFLSMALAPIINGYGMTETAGMGALTEPMAWTVDAHGVIPPSVEVKLVDYEDAGYLTANDPPQGEIWIRGAAITTGYYKNDEETRAALRPDGWFLTGDIGEFTPSGMLRVIDRKKNLVKTLNGEYIALEKLESAYRSSSLIGNVCVYAAEDRVKPLAIVVAKDAAAGADEAAVLKDLQKIGKAAGFAPFEIVDGVVVDEEEWTPQNGLMTAAMKLQRKQIVAKNKSAIDKKHGKK